MKKQIVSIYLPVVAGIICTLNTNIANAQWQQTSISSGNIYALASDGANVFSGGDNGVFVSTNNGSSWTASNTGMSGNDVRSFAISGATVFAGTFTGGVFKSTNTGSSWTSASSGITNPYIYALAISGTNIFAGTYGGGAFLSTNNGSSWTAVNTGLTNPYVRSFAVNGVNIFAGVSSGAFLSTNNGTNWTAVNNGLPSPGTTIVNALALSGTNILAASKNYGVYSTANNGSNWITMNFPAPNLNALAVSGSNIFVGTNPDGVYVSTNNGATWTAVNTGLTNTKIMSLTISGTHVFAGTYGAGVWKRPLSEMVTGIEESSDNADFMAYPNPTTGKVTVNSNFSMDKIEVYNVLGECVHQYTGTSSNMPAGQAGLQSDSYRIDLSSQPGGVYFVKLKSGPGTNSEGIVVKKLIIQR